MDYLNQIGRIYVIRANAIRASGPLKIGFTGGDPAGRLRDLQTGCPWQLELLGHVAGTRRNEFELLSGLRLDQMTGEWFAPTENVLRVVSRMLAPSFAFDNETGMHSNVLWAD